MLSHLGGDPGSVLHGLCGQNDFNSSDPQFPYLQNGQQLFVFMLLATLTVEAQLGTNMHRREAGRKDNRMPTVTVYLSFFLNISAF